MPDSHHPGSNSNSIAGHYIGRFAPTPSGPLHFGSLLAALASYLDARQQQGQWLVRMEDLDPPREQPGAADTILRQLEAHGLRWDSEVLYQSSRLDAYQAVLDELQHHQLAYPCDCTRQQIKAMGALYNGHCRRQPPTADSAVAYRIDTSHADHQTLNTVRFDDLFQGSQQWQMQQQCGDFIIKRRDGLFAYQLACAIDDDYQQITHVVRGSDLLDSTPRQYFLIALWRQLQNNTTPMPSYGHIPVAINPNGQKLSKQNLAPAIDSASASDNLLLALTQLNQPPPTELQGADTQTILDWACAHWQRERIPGTLTIDAPTSVAGG